MIERRLQPLRTTELDDELPAYIFVFFVALVILSIIGAFAFGVSSSDHNMRQAEKHDFAAMMYSDGDNANDVSESMRTKRKDLASDIVSFNDRLAVLDSDRYLSITTDQYDVLKNIAVTGDPVHVDDHRWKWGEYFRYVYLWPGLPILLLLFGLFVFLGYASDVPERYCLADLPWRKPWTWLLVLFTGPIGWIGFLVSGMRLRKLPPRLLGQAQNPYPAVVQDETAYERNAEKLFKETTYRSSPNSARQAYVDMRLRLLSSRRTARLEQVEASIEGDKDTLRYLGEQVKETQQSVNKLTAERRVIEEAMSQIDEFADPKVVAEEFERIMALPGVIAVQVVNDQLRIIVRAVHTYKGKKYDMGDWQMDFGPSVYVAHAVPIRPAVKPTWDGGYPDYRHGTGFCFGGRQYTLDEHLAKGQYMEAIALAVECLSSANEDDRKNIPSAFYEIKE